MVITVNWPMIVQVASVVAGVAVLYGRLVRLETRMDTLEKVILKGDRRAQ